TRQPGQSRLALIVLSAHTAEQLCEQAQRLLGWIEQGKYAQESLGQAQGLRDLAYTLQVGREEMEERLALQVSSFAELEEKLHGFLQEPQKAGDWYRGQVKSYDSMGTFAADEDGQKAVRAWMSKGQYEKLLAFWVKGLTIDWQQLY